jgi:hypothetical protein
MNEFSALWFSIALIFISYNISAAVKVAYSVCGG